jgi:hypothetical protein
VKRSRTKSQGFRRIEGGLEESPEANRQILQMCLIHREFKHFLRRKAKDFRSRRKVSSIM